jgi:hypothetical protein
MITVGAEFGIEKEKDLPVDIFVRAAHAREDKNY